MADERDYLDENGNDLRYGEYIGGDWYPDPPKVIELKKSGVWQTLREIERRWILDANLRPSAAGKAMLDEIAEESLERRRQYALEDKINPPKIVRLY